MKIVFLNPTGQLGGAERSLLEIFASLRIVRPDWSLHLIVGEAGPLVSKATELGVPTKIFPLPRAFAELGDAGVSGALGNPVSRLSLLGRLLLVVPALFPYLKQLGRTLREIAPDIVHTNGFKMHILGMWARPPRTPVLWHIHDYVSPRLVMSRLLKWHATRCSAVVTNSKSVAEDVKSICWNGVKVYPVYNGIDLERFSPAGPTLDLDALSGLSQAAPGTVRVGLLATLARWKGHEIFLEALSRLPASLAIRGYIVGGPLYQTEGSQYSLEELRRRAAQLGLSKKVGFTGFVEDPALAIRALDIVIHASTQREPFGLVILEAMACARAVIASETGGAAELVTEGTNALTFPPGDAALLAERIAELAADGELRAQLGKAGRATVERCFNRARLAPDLIPIYREVLSSTD